LVSIGTSSDILKMTEDSNDDYIDSQEGREVVKGKKCKESQLQQRRASILTTFDKIEDSDDDDDYHEGEVRERYDLGHEAPKPYPKTQTRSGLRRGFYKYGEGRVLADSGLTYSSREQRLEPTPPEEEGKVTESKESSIEPTSAKTQEHNFGGSTANST
jgi:hypothetical protein